MNAMETTSLSCTELAFPGYGWGKNDSNNEGFFHQYLKTLSIHTNLKVLLKY